MIKIFNKKENLGITLIALVITIIVLLILAGVAITQLTDSGLFGKTQEAKQKWENAQEDEQKKLDDLAGLLDNFVTGGGGTKPTQPETPISKTTSYIGKYADINGDGTIDGIIYADLLDTEHLSGDCYGIYSIDSTFSITTDVTASNVKDYVISQTSQTDSRWNSAEQKDVVRLATNQTGTKERFYVMGLDDITDGTNITLNWYINASGKMDDYATTTSGDFGTGRRNTSRIKAKWDLGTATGGYGAAEPTDMWGYLPTAPKAGANPTAAASDTEQYRWFIPSRAEWCAFICNLEIERNNYSDYNLRGIYWSSSQLDTEKAIRAFFGDTNGALSAEWVYADNFVRASSTF